MKWYWTSLLTFYLINHFAEKVDDEKPFTLHDEEYDFIDDGDDNNGHQGGGNDLNNYTYSYQEYDNGTESESEVDFVPELISQSRNIIAKTGDLIELPCKASVRPISVIWIYAKIWKTKKFRIRPFLFVSGRKMTQCCSPEV